jgi:uncharacterized protein (TIGR02246 family)
MKVATWLALLAALAGIPAAAMSDTPVPKSGAHVTPTPRATARRVARASAGSRADSLAMRRAIEAANLAYLDAFKRGDAQALAAVYDPDAVQFHPGGTYVRGRAALAGYFAGQMAHLQFISGTITSSSMWRVDDVAYDIGHYTFVFQPEGRDTLVERSRYLNLWRQQADGSWLIWRDLPVPRE